NDLLLPYTTLFRSTKNDPVYRRDSSFQQSAAGHSSARCGNWKSPTDRSDDLQSFLLREQRACLAFASFSTRAAARRTTRRIDRSRTDRQRTWTWELHG